jgi:hypothetical protein
VACFGQGTAIHEYPWNPDWNNDNFVGSSDLTGFLSAYGSEFGNPPEPCDYDGTPFEELVFGIADGTIVLDSVFVEFELEDTQTYFLTGCPDPVTDTLIWNNNAVLNYLGPHGEGWHLNGVDAYGSSFDMFFGVNNSNGTYRFIYNCNAMYTFDFYGDGFFGGGYQATTQFYPLPFPNGWYFDEEGMHITEGWTPDDWPYYANYLHILPYWHYAE